MPFAVNLRTLAALACFAGGCSERAPSASLPIWLVDPDPALDIGSADDPERGFNGVVGILRLAYGTIVVADRGSHSVRFFSADGEERARIGREGEGPGEFRDIGWIGRTSEDSLYVWDWGVRRVSVFDTEGEFARRITPQASPDGSARMVPAGVLASGSLVAQRSIPVPIPFRGPEGGVAVDSVRFGALDRDGAWQWESDARPEQEVFGLLAPTGRGLALVPAYRPFAPRLSWASIGDTLVVADAERGALEWFGPDGSSLRRLEVVTARAPVAAASIAAYRDAARRAVRDFAGTPRAQADAAFDAALAAGKVPIPAELPALDRILVTDLGDVWVQDPNTDGGEEYRTEGHVGSRWWTVISPDGTPNARIELPPEFRPSVVVKGAVIGVWSDEDGIEFVRMYRVDANP